MAERSGKDWPSSGDSRRDLPLDSYGAVPLPSGAEKAVDNLVKEESLMRSST